MRGRRHKLQVSTFPFLAVLLCAMGSLILVLLVMDRKAHQAAQARAQREAARLAEERAHSAATQQAERERLKQQARAAWEQKRDALHARLTREQVEMQLQMRKVREQLQEIAARLHYEQDTTTQLRGKVQSERDRLQAEEQLLRTLRSRSEQTANQSKESNQALRRMTLDLLQMEQALKDLQAERQRQQKMFSVVPYHGRRGENRRPIYVECTGQEVIFHPERKAISILSLLPGSDFPARAVREEVERRIARQAARLAALPPDADRTPYLLLLLRPGGVMTYHLFQQALKGVSVDFGYEFIDDDWVLDFPADDELPSKQPWMVATGTTPAASAPSSPVGSKPTPRGRVFGLAPMAEGTSPSAGGIRGFRPHEMGGATAWAKSGQSIGGSGSGGNGSSAPGGVAGVMGSPGMGGGSGTYTPSTQPLSPSSGEKGFRPGSPSQGREGSAQLPSPPGGGRGVGGEGVGGEGSGVFVNRGAGQGHPAALAPSFFGQGDSGGSLSGDGGPPVGGFGGGGTFRLGQSGAARGSGGSPGGAPGGIAGEGDGDSPGLGPPRALVGASSGTGQRGSADLGSSLGGAPGGAGPRSGIPGGGGLAGGVPGGGGGNGFVSGTGSRGDGRLAIAQGNAGGAGSGGSVPLGSSAPGMQGSAGPGMPGGGFASGTGARGDGRGAIAQGNGGGVGSGGSAPAGASAPGMRGSAAPGIPGNGGSGTGGQGNSGLSGVSGSSVPPGDNGTSGWPGGSPSPGNSGGARGSASAATGTQPGPNGGAPGGDPSAGPSSPGNAGSGDRVIFIDPVTGKPTAAPRPANPRDAPPESSPPPDGKRGPPRVQTVLGYAGGSGGGEADGESEAINRFAPTPSMVAPRRRPVAVRPAWVHGGRDLNIYIECRADSLVLYPSQREFPLAAVLSDPAGNPLVKAIQQMIERRQSARRPEEPPYRPQLYLLVRPEFARTFLTVSPALDALPLPKTRRNLDADDDVLDIVTGAKP